MKTHLDCIPCLLRQTLFAARQATDSVTVQKEILDRVNRLLPSLDLSISPPENSVYIYRVIAGHCGKADPFAALKEDSNKMALALKPELEKHIAGAADALLMAIKLSIAGNIIDYGSQQEFNVEESINRALGKPFAVNDYEKFQDELSRAKNILYLADNCGELVFDGLLIKELGKIGKKVTMAVKEKPVINDALQQDAEACGLNKLCSIISNGTDCPGTPVEQCSSEFQEIFKTSDLIISKGQGNFETLSDRIAPIYFLLTIKCPVVAGHVEEKARPGKAPVKPGAMVLMRSPHSCRL